MCGIVCVFAPAGGGSPSYRSQAVSLGQRLRHRGPDWSGTHAAGCAILHHERLAIVGVTSGAQPLLSADGQLALAVNGEIYNHQEITSRAQALMPRTYSTSSDCECLLHLYECGGADTLAAALPKITGMFAFALHDAVHDSYIVARDHLGLIPLYWGRDKHGARWISSELKAIADVCEDVMCFPPGHVYDSRTGELRRWYAPAWFDGAAPSAPLGGSDMAAAAKGLRTALMAAVQRHLMSDVPYGVLLSGGLDSSIIAAVAAHFAARRIEDGGKTVAHWPRLHTFSIGLKGSPDLAAAATVAEHIGSVHHGFEFTVQEGLDALSEVVFHTETYDVTTIRAATPMFLLARRIKAAGVKMVLSGEGADELFGGYLYFHKAPSAAALHAECVAKLRALHLFDCLRANKACAAWGVEARVPFLDREFVDEAAMAVAPALKLCGARAGDGRIEKHVLRAAFADMLPDDVAWRQKEQFSDGVGYGWIDALKDTAAARVSADELSTSAAVFPVNPPVTREAYLIRSHFAKHFPQTASAQTVPGGPSVACSTSAALEWDASFRTLADCSGRAVAGVHVAALSEKERRDQVSAGMAAAAPAEDV